MSEEKCDYPTYNICVTRNNVFNLVFFREVDDEVFSFDGKSLVLTVRSYVDGKEIIVLSSDTGEITLEEYEGVVGGLVRVSVNSGVVRGWKNGIYVYDLVYFTDPTDVKTVLGGNFTISKGVSDVR